MKRLGLFILVASLAGGAFAQDLETVTISDQFNVGVSRGNNEGMPDIPDDPLTTEVDESVTLFGASSPDGTDFEDYDGPDVTTTVNGTEVTTSIRYINTWAGYSESPPRFETPVQTVTAPMDNHDRGLTDNITQVVANPNPTATGGDTGILIGDDGGYNALFFGESNDRNYFVEVDMFCPGLTVGAGFEELGLVARAARDDGPSQPDRADYSYSPYLDGSYSIFFEYETGTAIAAVYADGGTPTTVGTATSVADGWHTARIECLEDQITFYFDGVEIAEITDSSETEGRPGLYYVESSVSPSAERQGLFDNLRAGPVSESAVSDWNLY